jgi:hypothetical protein
MSIRNPSRFSLLFATVSQALAGAAVAQTCAAPTVLAANQTYIVDTCQGDSFLQLACGVVPLTGRAAIMQLSMPYPGGGVTVQSIDAGYDPAVFLIRAKCDAFAECDAVVWEGPSGTTNDVPLFEVDSGVYFVAVAPTVTTPGNASCGHVLVTWSFNLGDGGFLHEGIFRSGIAPIWKPSP